jgi:PEP-CTERM motif
MKLNPSLIAVIGGVFIGAALPANASTLYLSSSTPDGFTPGPYQGTLNGVGVQLYCDDAIDNAPIGGSWTVDVTSIANSTSNTRFGEATSNDGTSTSYFPAGTTQAQLPTGIALYQELAWLFTQLVTQTNATIKQGIQDAAWDLTSTGGPADDLADAKVWIAAAVNDYNKTSGIAPVSVDGTAVTVINPAYSNWMILTDPDSVNKPAGGGNQEFLAYYNTTSPGDPPSAAPEPASFGLLGGGLFAFGTFATRKRRAATSRSA